MNLKEKDKIKIDGKEYEFIEHLENETVMIRRNGIIIHMTLERFLTKTGETK